MSDGETVRCHAVSKTKLNAIRAREGNPGLQADDVWPEGQCERSAVPGKLLCGGRGGHGGNSTSVPTFDPLEFMPVDVREKLQFLIRNPTILSRRFEIAQLVARYLALYERLTKNEALGKSSLEHIREGLEDIHNGEIVVGAGKISEALELRENEKETYAEIYQTMALLKDMTGTEIKSIKEMRGMITLEQFIAAMDGVAGDLVEALEKYVPDERIRDNVAGFVERRINRRFSSGSAGVLAAASEVVDGDILSSTESVAE
jgi:hypothetical protein